jgi:alpha-tubulin suppressor-like RCC1 family protein
MRKLLFSIYVLGIFASCGEGLYIEEENSQTVNTYQVFVGYDSNCVMNLNKQTKCWGDGNSGALGLGNTDNIGNDANEMGDNLALLNLGTNRSVKSMSGGEDHFCAILDNDTLKCWGQAWNGQLGQGNGNNLGDDANEMGDNLNTVDLGTGLYPIAITSGDDFNCAILNDNSVKCWGDNNNGQLGKGHSNRLGNDPNEMGDNLTKIDLGIGRTAKQLAAGEDHVCALLDNATVKCWGRGSSGQLGQGNGNNLGDDANEMGDFLPTIDLGTTRTVKSIFAGNDTNCAILDNNTTKCWGSNSNGELGKGNTDNLGDDANEMGDNLAIMDFGSNVYAKQIALGSYHGCVLLSNNTIKCWGEGTSGQLGTENTNTLGDDPNEMGDNLQAVNIGSDKTIYMIDSFHQNTCAVLNIDDVKCWGKGDRGQLGQGNSDNLGDNAGEMGDSLLNISLNF